MRRARISAGAGALLAAYTALGVYVVDADESGVAYRFGRAVARDVLPGIHWSPPWPFGRVEVATTATSFIMPVGYRIIPSAGPPISSLWLTADTNALTARLNLQYSIDSLSAFLTMHEEPREVIRLAAESALTSLLLAEPVDDALGPSRARLRSSVRDGVQRVLDLHDLGVVVQSVTIEQIAPPNEGRVRAAFQDVQSAIADRGRLVLDAQAYRRQTLAEVDGRAERIRAEARAAKHRRVTLARGEASRFRALALEHANAPEVTEQRIHLETLERLLPGLDTIVVESDGGERVNLRVVR